MTTMNARPFTNPFVVSVHRLRKVIISDGRVS